MIEEITLKWKSVGKPNPAIFKGFHPHRPGRIHLYCPNCGRKMSNTVKGADDPAEAALVVVRCDKYGCSGGGWVEGGDFYDSKGRPLDFE